MRHPGFVDLQVNGYLGIDFSGPDLTEESFLAVCAALEKKGTAGFLPTVITSSAEIYERNLPLMAKALRHPEARRMVLGFHLEGPFISPDDGYRGAHPKPCVREPDPAFLDRLQSLAMGEVKLLTVAAERPACAALIAHAVAKGIRVSLGHQNASATDLEGALAAGATALTHLGNGIPSTMARHPNPIWDGLAEDKILAMVITDGHHVPDRVLKSFFRAKGEKILVVSDASPIAGLPAGRYEALGNPAVIEPNGRLYNPETGYLVGSSYSMIECMNHLATCAWHSEGDLVTLGTHRPLAYLGLDRNRLAESPMSLEFDGWAFRPNLEK
ncbi:MAG: amidohydrolase family protein [Spirochaetes bacterium]|nr:amidohydrolase family protein [Spirochaetota bacterium]